MFDHTDKMVLEVHDLKFSNLMSKDCRCIIKIMHGIFSSLVFVKGTQLLETGSVSVIRWKCEVGSITRFKE
jgi:hypothetical protein